MKTSTVADLRNHFRRVSGWIENGEKVEIIKRGRPFALLSPRRSSDGKPGKINFAKQLKEIWGNKIFTDAEVRQMRAFELEGEEG